MIVQAITVSVIVMVLGGLVLIRTRGRTVRMVYVIPLWIAAACGVIIGGASISYYSALRTYDQCTARVDRAQGNRTQTLALYDAIDVATGTRHFTADSLVVGVPSLRQQLDMNLPVLSFEDCRHP